MVSGERGQRKREGKQVTLWPEESSMEQRLVSGPPAGQFNEASSGVRATAICGIRGIHAAAAAAALAAHRTPTAAARLRFGSFAMCLMSVAASDVSVSVSNERVRP